ncbi:MAG: nuclear transport factor 2 family protein [Candidatus Pacebacteria bacterium]|nr:nuclear transport factor 2 family protein [Candidatus Paceibacterota bacterium]
MTKEKALELLNIYGKAWVTRDPDLIVTIFIEDATYNDPHEPENIGREAIRAYWMSKVVGEQKDISFKLLNYWVTDNEVIAEWYAEFIDTKRNLKIQMTEVAIFTVKGDKFGGLREYYKTVKTPL